MTDIISRLLDEGEKAQRKGHLLLAEVCRDASDRIGLLEHDNERLRAEIVLLEATGAEASDEIERLRACVLAARREGIEAAAKAAKALTHAWRNPQQRHGVAFGEAITGTIRALLTEGGR